MIKTGILLHVYHLEANGWEQLIWGDPVKDELGTGTKFIECLLNIPFDQQVVSVIYSGPSKKDGLSEGAYTKRYLLDRIDKLGQFPRLRQRLDQLSRVEYMQFVERVRGLAVGQRIRDTAAEIEAASAYFVNRGVHKVLQVTSVTHAPRCIKVQGIARQKGLIDKAQQWFTVISDSCFAGSGPADVVILEPPHRADDPIIDVHPTLPEIMEQYQYELSPEVRKVTLSKIGQLITDALAQ